MLRKHTYRPNATVRNSLYGLFESVVSLDFKELTTNGTGYISTKPSFIDWSTSSS